MESRQGTRCVSMETKYTWKTKMLLVLFARGPGHIQVSVAYRLLPRSLKARHCPWTSFCNNSTKGGLALMTSICSSVLSLAPMSGRYDIWTLTAPAFLFFATPQPGGSLSQLMPEATCQEACRHEWRALRTRLVLDQYNVARTWKPPVRSIPLGVFWYGPSISWSTSTTLFLHHHSLDSGKDCDSCGLSFKTGYTP